jgi:2-dehydropantoate 2-reductase
MAKICIYGAGSIGCYVGGRLLAGGSDVSFIGRARMANQLRGQGITLSRHDDRHWHVPPERTDVSTDAATAAAADLVLVTVKSAATPAAAAELANVLRPGTIVVSFQNGIGNADVLRCRRAPCLRAWCHSMSSNAALAPFIKVPQASWRSGIRRPCSRSLTSSGRRVCR